MLVKRVSTTIMIGLIVASMTGCNNIDRKQLNDLEIQVEQLDRHIRELEKQLPLMEQEANHIEEKVQEKKELEVQTNQKGTSNPAAPKLHSESKSLKQLEDEMYDAGYEYGKQLKEQLEQDGKYDEFVENYNNTTDGDGGHIAPTEEEQDVLNIQKALEETYEEEQVEQEVIEDYEVPTTPQN